MPARFGGDIVDVVYDEIFLLIVVVQIALWLWWPPILYVYGAVFLIGLFIGSRPWKWIKRWPWRLS